MRSHVTFRSLEGRATGAVVRQYEGHEAVRETVGHGLHGVGLWEAQGPAEARFDLSIFGDREVAMVGIDSQGRMRVAARLGAEGADIDCSGGVQGAAVRLDDGWVKVRLLITEPEPCRYELITLAYGLPAHEGSPGAGFDVRDISLEIGVSLAPKTAQALSWQRVVVNEKAFGDTYKDLTVTLLRARLGDTALASVSSRISRAGGKTFFELRPLDSNPILLPSATEWQTDDWGPLLKLSADTSGGQSLQAFAAQLSFDDRDLLRNLLENLPDVVKAAGDQTTDAKGWSRAASQVRRYLGPAVAE